MKYRKVKIRDFRKESKYKNIRQTYNNFSYASKLEAKTAQELDLRMKSESDDRIIEWNRQVKIELTAHGEFICNYYIDFVAERADGVKEYIECKGIETKDWRIKWQLFLAQYKEQIQSGEIEPIIVKS